MWCSRLEYWWLWLSTLSSQFWSMELMIHFLPLFFHPFQQTLIEIHFYFITSLEYSYQCLLSYAKYFEHNNISFLYIVIILILFILLKYSFFKSIIQEIFHYLFLVMLVLNQISNFTDLGLHRLRMHLKLHCYNYANTIMSMKFFCM